MVSTSTSFINGKNDCWDVIIVYENILLQRAKTRIKKNENCTAGCIVHKGVHISREEKENTGIVD